MSGVTAASRHLPEAGDGPFLKRLWKPWFVYRPSQLIRRALVSVSPPTPGYRALPTSWGVPVRADPTKMIGHAILTTGVYDLAVSEVLTRLVDPGDTVVDAGANVGYMTVLASVLAGPEGSVIAFEPHPDLFAVLQQNVADARRRFQIAPVDLHNDAVGERTGRAQLLLPADFGTNDGIARIAETPDEDGRTIPVPVVTLDSTLGEQRKAILKLDVEGFELQALRGAAHALRTGRIRHIVFEDHQIQGSVVAAFLRELGFSLFSVGWSNSGLEVVALDNRALARQYEAPSFVASIDPDEVGRRCAARGFRALNALARSRRAG